MKLTGVYQRAFRAWSAIPRALHATGSPFPLEVTVSITHRCNLNCSYCVASPVLNRDEQELSADEWLDFIGSTPRLSMCVFAGGEPFLRPDFVDILTRAMRLRRSLVVTNGSVIPPEFHARAVEGRLLLASFSLDGIGAVHDRFRNMVGSFDLVVENIERLQQEKARRGARRPMLSLSMVLLPGNIHQVVDMARLADRLGVDFLTFGLYSPPVRFLPSLDDDSLMRRPHVASYDLAVLREQFRQLDQEKPRVDMRFLPSFHSADSMLAYLEREADVELTDVFHACGAPYASLFVTPNGDLFPCRVFHPVGNIRERAFRELWNGEALRRFRGKLCEEKLFPSCIRCCRLQER